MGQILTLDSIISIIEIKSSPDIQIKLLLDIKIKLLQDIRIKEHDQEHYMEYILNFELIEEKISN